MSEHTSNVTTPEQQPASAAQPNGATAPVDSVPPQPIRMKLRRPGSDGPEEPVEASQEAAAPGEAQTNGHAADAAVEAADAPTVVPFSATKSATLAPPRPSIKLSAKRLRIGTTVGEEVVFTRRILSLVPVMQRPSNQVFVRTHPDPAMLFSSIGILDYNADRRPYAVAPEIADIVKRYYRLYYLIHAVAYPNKVFLWMLPMPGEDGSWNAWHEAKFKCAMECKKEWRQFHTENGTYTTVEAHEKLDEPDWDELLYPRKTIDELVELAFADTFIDSEEHPVVKALLGKK